MFLMRKVLDLQNFKLKLMGIEAVKSSTLLVFVVLKLKRRLKQSCQKNKKIYIS